VIVVATETIAKTPKTTSEKIEKPTATTKRKWKIRVFSHNILHFPPVRHNCLGPHKRPPLWGTCPVPTPSSPNRSDTIRSVVRILWIGRLSGRALPCISEMKLEIENSSLANWHHPWIWLQTVYVFSPSRIPRFPA